VSWLGVTLGEPVTAVSARMGDPIAVGKDPKLAKFVYLVEHGNAFLTVLSERGYVSGVRLWSVTGAPGKTLDPFGIALGEQADALTGKRGKPTRSGSDIDGPFDAYQNGDVLWLYHIRGNQSVASITLSTTESAIEDLPEAPLPAVHTGASAADAIVVVQPDAKDVARWEQMYLAIHPCGANGVWKSNKTERQGKTDVLSATCSDGPARTFYFTTP
jgi:hypothetical protein